MAGVEKYFYTGKPIQSFLISAIAEKAEENRILIEDHLFPMNIELPKGSGVWERVSGTIFSIYRLWLLTPEGRGEYEEFCPNVGEILRRNKLVPPTKEKVNPDGGITMESLSNPE